MSASRLRELSGSPVENQPTTFSRGFTRCCSCAIVWWCCTSSATWGRGGRGRGGGAVRASTGWPSREPASMRAQDRAAVKCYSGVFAKRSSWQGHVARACSPALLPAAAQAGHAGPRAMMQAAAAPAPPAAAATGAAHLLVALAVRHGIAVLHLHHAVADGAQQRANDALLALRVAPDEGVCDGEQNHGVHPASIREARRAAMERPPSPWGACGRRRACPRRPHLTLFSVAPTGSVSGAGAILLLPPPASAAAALQASAGPLPAPPQAWLRGRWRPWRRCD